MAFDGCLLNMVIHELSVAEGSFVDKIFQPSKDEFVFLIRTKEGAKRLFISAHSGSARIHFTEIAPENPPTPPMFCMLLRKHLGSSRIVSISSSGLERMVKITFSATNEMGDRISPSLIAEFIGTSPNIILLGHDGRIIDCLRRSDLEKQDNRIVQPGAVYTLPTASGKLDLSVCSAELVLKDILKREQLTVQNAIVESVAGVSPRTAKMLCELSDIAPTREVATLSGWENKLLDVLDRLKYAIKNKTASPVLIKNKNNAVTDFGFSLETNITCQHNSFSKMLDEFYTEREKVSRTAAASKDLIKLVSNFQKRSIRKLNLRLKELEDCKDRETLRLYGELLKANLHCINAGSTHAEVCNYYDENMSMIKIPLKPELSPAANAARYFKEYKKACTAEHTLRGLIEQNRLEIDYLGSVYDSLNRADSISLLDDIREELALSGYLKLRKTTAKAKKTQKLSSEISPSGLTIYIGRNNLQNDYLTTKIAVKDDIWFHTKNIAGSHVVLATGGKPYTDEDIVFAATLAAKNSKAADSPKVEVDYTQIKNVKKPAGAKPGMVIYKTNRTVIVNPTEN